MVHLIQADAANLPLPDGCVDLVVTSPPYFTARSYRDNGAHFGGQLGQEPTPAAYVAALIDCTREMIRVLKPSGSIWVNLGDKYAGAPSGTQNGVPRNKSLIGLPWRYALRCTDDLGLILRAEVIWSKPNALPESITDRVRRSHETWFHFVKQPRYYAALDLIRQPYAAASIARYSYGRIAGDSGGTNGATNGPLRSRREPGESNPLGALPSSVWTIATQPLKVPVGLGVNHFAAFPMALPRRIITGWSPADACTRCGEGRRPIVEGPSAFGSWCVCPDPTASTAPGIVLHPFGGTGTTALVASVLGRTGISVDMSRDYGRLAQWRTTDPRQRAYAGRDVV